MRRLPQTFATAALIFLAMGSFLSCKDSRSDLNADPETKAFIHIGPEDTTTPVKRIFVIATAKDVDSLGICELDAKGACLNNQLLPTKVLTSPSAERKFFQTMRGFAEAKLGLAFRVQGFDANRAALFTNNFSLTDPSGAATTEGTWKVVLVSSKAGLDATRTEIKTKITARGVKETNIKEVMAGAASSVSVEAISKAFAALNIGPQDGCLLYINAEGTQAQGLTIGAESLAAPALDLLLTTACKTQPTVALISANYSGALIATETKKAHRIIMTSTSGTARAVAQTGNAPHPMWDECLLSTIAAATTWPEWHKNVGACVTQKEQAAGPATAATQSQPQAFFGSEVEKLSVLKETVKAAAVIPGPNQPAPPPAKAAVQLGQKDVELTNIGDQKVKMSSLFGDADYLIVEISLVGCGPCNALADYLEAQKAALGSKCAVATVLGADKGRWLTTHPSAGPHTFEYPNPFATLPAKFGATAGGAPSGFMIDRNGQKVSEFIGFTDPGPGGVDTGPLGTFISQKCK